MKRVLPFLILLGCSDTTPKLDVVYAPNAVEVRPKVVTYAPSIDIVFVIDDSGSMYSHQVNLSNNIELFVQGVSSFKANDFRIGVITSSPEKNGRFFAPWVEKSTPNLERELKTSLMVGTWGSGYEQFFTPLYQSIFVHDPLATKRFYRSESLLVIIFVTDTGDQSNTDAQVLYEKIFEFKKKDAEKILFFAIRAPYRSNCEYEEEAGNGTIDRFLQLTKGFDINLCDPQFGQRLAEIGNIVNDRAKARIPLPSRPILDTITVKFGDILIPPHLEHGWYYEPDRVGLAFGSGLVLDGQPDGTTFEVTYRPHPLE